MPMPMPPTTYDLRMKIILCVDYDQRGDREAVAAGASRPWVSIPWFDRTCVTKGPRSPWPLVPHFRCKRPPKSRGARAVAWNKSRMSFSLAAERLLSADSAARLQVRVLALAAWRRRTLHRVHAGTGACPSAPPVSRGLNGTGR